MKFGSLFAGIGGFDLGLERAGMTCSWQVEIDGYARRVLERHWPDVRRWDDVRTFPPPDGDWGVDLICGGFPCQDISNAGKRDGIDGKRSGLWSEFARIIGFLRPRYVVVENVANLLSFGMGRVLGDLAEIGYDAEWEVIPASAVGAPHERERVYIVSYSHSFRRDGTDRGILEREARWRGTPLCFGWESERGIQRVAHGVPSEVDRVECLGNAVVPQVAEWIGRRILESDHLR